MSKITNTGPRGTLNRTYSKAELAEVGAYLKRKAILLNAMQEAMQSKPFDVSVVEKLSTESRALSEEARLLTANGHVIY